MNDGRILKHDNNKNLKENSMDSKSSLYHCKLLHHKYYYFMTEKTLRFHHLPKSLKYTIYIHRYYFFIQFANDFVAFFRLEEQTIKSTLNRKFYYNNFHPFAFEFIGKAILNIHFFLFSCHFRYVNEVYSDIWMQNQIAGDACYAIVNESMQVISQKKKTYKMNTEQPCLF